MRAGTRIIRGDPQFRTVANSYSVNPAIGIQMSTYDLLSGTLTFLLFVILTPFAGAGSHAASCLSVLVRETQPTHTLATI